MQLGQFRLFTPSEAAAALLDLPQSDPECQIEDTGRLLLPDHLLQRLSTCQPPFLFRLSRGQRVVYLGYPVFRSFRVADGAGGRDWVMVPAWAAAQLRDSVSDPNGGSKTPSSPAGFSCSKVSLSTESLQPGSFICLRPLEPADVTGWANPAATLNKKLRDFACLSQGSVFSIRYLDRTFHFEIKSLKPARAVCIIDCDMHLEFDLNEEATAESGTTTTTADASAAGTDHHILRDALTRAQLAADAEERRWGAGVSLATGLEVTAPPNRPSCDATSATSATTSAPMRSQEVTPNLAYEWGALTFTRPAGRYRHQPAAAQGSAGSAKGVRLKDSLN